MADELPQAPSPQPGMMAGMMPGMMAPAGPVYDDDAIRSLVERKMNEWSKGRRPFEIAVYMAILYYLGRQWVRYDVTTNRIRPSILRPKTPTPVTNRFASTMDAFISLLARVEPRLQFPPATDEPEDQATADVCDRVMEVIEEEVGIRYQRQFGAVWNGLTGGFWLETGYDADPVHGTVFLQHEQCKVCGGTQPPMKSKTCQGCGAGMLSPAMDPTGQPMGEDAPKGKMYVDVVPLLEMFFDPSITDWKKMRACCRQRAVSLDDAKTRWKDIADKIQPDTMTSASEFYVDNLANIGPGQIDERGGRGIAGTTGTGSNTKVTERWFYMLPDDTYPEGLLAVIVGKTLVAHKGPLPYSSLNADGTRTPFINFVWFPQKLRPGSLWPKTIASDLIPKQAQRNRLESLAEQIAMRMANPVWIVPQGAGVRNMTGDAGQIIEYNALGPGTSVAKPERIQGQNVPATIIQMMEMIDQDFEELGGCLLGDTPIPCLDGVTRTMRELADKYPSGGMWVYGFDRDAMRIVPAHIVKAFLTGHKHCVRVTFKEGTYVDCTDDHPFLTWDRGYIRADQLREDEPVVPLIFHDSGEYISVAQPVDRKDELVQRMVAHELLGLPRGKAGRKHDVHHKDERKTNNLPANLEVLSRREHMLKSPQRFAIAKNNHDSWIQGGRARKSWEDKTEEQKWKRLAPMLAARSKNPDLKAKWTRLNHRVASVVPIGDHDVYDLTTSTHNFGTDAGVFVHNTFQVIKGDRPEGVSAGIALQLLKERGESRFAPMFILWEQSHADWAVQALEIFREYASEERMLRVKGRDGSWEIQHFMGADLKGRVNVIPEAASAFPKSTLTERAEIEQGIALGLINVGDSETRRLAAARFNLMDMMPGMQVETKNALRENEAFMMLAQSQMAQVGPDAIALASQMPGGLEAELGAVGGQMGLQVPRVKPAIDDHAVHGQVHRDFARSETGQKLPPAIMALLEAHLQMHDQLEAMKMQAVMAARSGTFPTSGFLSNPGGQASPMRSGSSGKRMQGDENEMAGKMSDQGSS